MSNKAYFLHYSPIMKTSTEGGDRRFPEENAYSSANAAVGSWSKNQVGTRISLIPAKLLEGRIAPIREKLLQASELQGQFGIEIKLPDSIPACFEGNADEAVASMETDELLEESASLVTIRFGISGWYVESCQAAQVDAVSFFAASRARIDKYFYREGSVAEIICKAELPSQQDGCMADAQDLYFKHTEKAPDARYAL